MNLVSLQVKSGTEQILLNNVPLTDLFTVLTFCLLLVTIIVSVRALRENARSNILSSSPVLVLKYVTTRGSLGEAIDVENVGHGAALNVRVENYYTTFLDDMMIIEGNRVHLNKPINAVLRFNPVDLVLEGKTASFDISRSRGGGFFTAEILAHQMMNVRKKLTFRIRYSDIAGVQYISKITISQNHIRVVGHPKRYNLARKLIYYLYLIEEQIRMRLIYRPISRFKQLKVNKQMQESYDQQLTVDNGEETGI